MQTLKNILNQVVSNSLPQQTAFSEKTPLGTSRVSMAQKSAMLEKTLMLQKINQFWLQNLPENLKPCSMVGDLNKGVLTVFATQNAVAAKIKLMTASLLIQLKNQLKSEGIEVTAIQVKVQVKSAGKPQKIKLTRQLSRQTATQLQRLAETMQGSDLAESLQRLAGRFKND